MSAARQTPIQGLKQIHQDSLRLLYSYATTTRDAASHRWTDPARKERCDQLVSFIKRDLEEFQKRLKAIQEKHDREITSAVLNNPSHPTMLAAGGDYYNFIDQVNATILPMSGELMDLIGADQRESTLNKAVS